MTVTVDAATEAGVTNAGRRVMIFLDIPETTVTASAIETRTVAWAGGFNKITTAGSLGQSAISLNPANYWIVLLGPIVSRGTDLRLDATLAYVGNVTGAGAGNPPVSQDTSDQHVYPPSGLGGFWNIIEIDAHGNLKIRVRPCAADVNQRQLSVSRQGAPADTVWSVDENGDMEVRSFGAGVASPSVQCFDSDGDGVRLIQTATGAVLQTSGAAGLPGDIKIATTPGSFVRPLAPVHGDAAGLRLIDDNVAVAHPAGIQLGGAAPDDAIDSSVPQNVVGLFNRVSNVQRHNTGLTKECVLGGALPSDGGGLDVDLTEGHFSVDGYYRVVAAQSVAIPDNSTRFLYCRTSDMTYQLSSTLPLLAVAYIPICKVVTLAGAISSIQDMRIKTVDINWPISIPVGCVDAIADATTPGPGCWFATVRDAVNVIRNWTNPDEGGALSWMPRSFEIVVVGQTVETAEIEIDFDGVHIRGIPGRQHWVGGAPPTHGAAHGMIVWSGDRALFHFTTSSLRHSFQHLEIAYNSAVAPAAGVDRNVFEVDALMTVDEVMIDNVQQTNFNEAADNFVYCLGISWNWTIRNCSGVTFNNGISVAFFKTLMIDGCNLAASATPLANGCGIRLNAATSATVPHRSAVIRHCDVTDFDLYGIYCGSAADVAGLKIDGNRIYDVGDTGITLERATRCCISNNTVYAGKNVLFAGTARGICLGLAAGASHNVITGNEIRISAASAAGTQYALDLPAGSNKNVATGNHFNGFGFNNAGGNNKVSEVFTDSNLDTVTVTFNIDVA